MMYSMFSWFQILLLIGGLLFTSAKPIQNDNRQPPPARRMDTLAGFSIGANKATRSLPEFSRRALDSLGDGNILRSLDSIGGGNFLRSLDSLGGGNILRDLDSIEEANLLRSLNALGVIGNLRHMPNSEGFDYRSLDSLGGANMLRSESRSDPGHSGKRLDSLSGLTLGHQKRTFDEIDRTAFDGFSKRNFDEIDRVGFDGFAKRNAPVSS